MSSGPNVLHITGTLRVSYVLEVVKAVEQSGCPVNFVCPTDFVYLSGVKDVISGQTLTPASVSAKRLKLGVLLWPRIAIQAIQSLSPRPSIAHLNFPCHDLFAPWFIKRLRRMGYVVVYTVHDPIPHDWLGKVSRRRALYWMLHAAYKACNILVVHTAQGRDILVREFQVPTDKIKVIPFGTYEIAESALPYTAEPEFTTLLFGGLRVNKGIDLAIRAVQEMRKEGQPVRLIIAGSCRGELNVRYWEECKALIAQSPDGIEVIDRYLPDEELPNLLTRSHLMLMPYTEFYSQSAVAALALSNGRALVATDVGGLSDLVAHKEAVIPIDEPTVPAVKKALASAIQEGHEALRIRGLEGRRIVETLYSWEAIGKQYRKLYEELSSK